MKKASKRVLLKLSGEALAGAKSFGFSDDAFVPIVKDIVEAHRAGVSVAIVVGGGNFIRGARDVHASVTRVAVDQMGMLSTVINGLALQDALFHEGARVKHYSAIDVPGVSPIFDIHTAKFEYDQGDILVLSGGTGNPFVTTDSAASLRSIQLEVDLLLKATKVDGVYSADPKLHADAERFDRLTFSEALKRELAVMDLAAFCQCRDYGIPIRVFNLFKPGALKRALMGEPEGTFVGNGE